MTRTLLLLLLCCGARELIHAQVPELQRGPYLQMANPTALTVCWRTDVPGTGRVRCGTEENALTLTFNAAAPATDHAVRLTGLTPATHYYYAVETDGAALAGGAGFHFYTPPADGADVPVRFWVLGDPGTANLAAGYVRDAFGPLHAQRRADLWLMLGDNAYPSGADASFQNAVFNMYPDYLKTVPLWSCLGNHETYAGTDASGQFAYERIFAFPAAGECGGVATGTERYYSWNHGRIHFISLDSMTASRAPNGAMAQWLEADLQANTLPWVVAFWHHPPYSKGSHNSDTEYELVQMREYILPILEDHGVDLVLCGHSHNYERSFLLDGHYGHSSTLGPIHKKGPGSGRPGSDGAYYKAGAGMTPHQGAVYVTAGSSGQVGGGLLNHPAHYIALSRLGSVVVDVAGLRMDVKFLRETTIPGAAPVFDDSFTIIKGVEPPPTPQLLRGPYLQKATPTAMTVRWRTSLPGTGRVRYGTSAAGLTSSVVATTPGAEHSVRLTGLAPGTKYFYQVETAGIPLAAGPQFHFTTPPPAGSTGPVRIWVLGDCGTQGLEQQAVRDAFLPVHAEQPADLWLMLGDNAYGTGTDQQYQGAVFDMYHPWLEQIPLWSCIGNHETYHEPDGDGRFAWDRIFDFPTAGECGGVASGTERYYSWNHANIHFITLDSQTADRSAQGPMAQWLTADLQANTLPWVIACWHHPPYTKGSHDSDFEFELVEMREHIVPILEQYGVDLVLCGHSHSYERSYLLDGHYGDSTQFLAQHLMNDGNGRADGDGIYLKPSAGPAPHEGAVYIVAGSSGQLSGGKHNHPAHFLSLNELGSVVLDIHDQRMDVRFLREDFAGNEAPLYDDWFTIVKGGPALPRPATGLSAIAAGPDRAAIHWTDHSTHEERYEVLLSTAAQPFALVATLPPDAAGCTLTGLVHGTGYSIKVVASNLTGAAASLPLAYTHNSAAAPLTPHELWRYLHWGTTSASGDRDPAADPENDSYSNLLEYALGSSPRLAHSLPQLTAARDANGRLTLTFQRQAAPDLTYAVEFSSTLAPDSWQTAWTSTGPDNIPGPVTIPDPAAPAPARRFVRLRVTLTPP